MQVPTHEIHFEFLIKLEVVFITKFYVQKSDRKLYWFGQLAFFWQCQAANIINIIC